MDNLDKFRFIQIANHEAGHYIVATVLGFKTGEITIIIKDDKKKKACTKIILDEPLSNINNILDFCYRRVQVSLCWCNC